MSHTAELAMHSVWMNWADKSMPFDLSWRNLIWGPGPRVISFVLNATMNTMPTPDLLHLMKISESAKCGLCGADQCTLFHILSNCNKSLKDKRYSWRHDSVLATVLQLIVPKLIQHNSTSPSPTFVPIAFVKKGTAQHHVSKHRSPANQKNTKSLLDAARDWQLLIDFDCHKMLFPVCIVATDERPDIVLWSTSSKIVIMIELTCPAEENFDDAKARKEKRYSKLCDAINEAGWTVFLRTVESGARGFVGHRFRKVFREIGFSASETTRACKHISTVTSRCSYGIWLQRKSKTWNSSRELVVPNSFLSPPPTWTPPPLLEQGPTVPTDQAQNWHLQLRHGPGVKNMNSCVDASSPWTRGG